MTDMSTFTFSVLAVFAVATIAWYLPNILVPVFHFFGYWGSKETARAMEAVRAAMYEELALLDASLDRGDEGAVAVHQREILRLSEEALALTPWWARPRSMMAGALAGALAGIRTWWAERQQ